MIEAMLVEITSALVAVVLEYETDSPNKLTLATELARFTALALFTVWAPLFTLRHRTAL